MLAASAATQLAIHLLRHYVERPDADDPARNAAAPRAVGLAQAFIHDNYARNIGLAEIAEAQNVELSAITEAALATMTEHLNTLVESGVLTQEQADARLAYMAGHISTMPMFTGTPCPMAGTGFGRGMMGRGMGGYGRGMMWRRG